MLELSPIRQVRQDEFDKLWQLYLRVVDSLVGQEFHPGWYHDVYPTEDLVKSFLVRSQAWVGQIGDEFAAVANINHEVAPGYESVNWAVDAKDEEVTSVHVLAVDPKFQGQGIAKQLVNQLIEKARADGQKAIRLDVYPINRAGRSLYESCGFIYHGMAKLYYEDTDWLENHMYEYLL